MLRGIAPGTSIKNYGTFSVTSPGEMMVMTPAQVHISFDELFSAGNPATKHVGDPGTHGAGVTGIHGMGVKTPSAAAVALATVGLAMLVHIPNGMTFTIGILSMMFAAGIFDDVVRFFGNTV